MLKEWGGELIEPDYTTGISSTGLRNALKEIGTTPDIRRRLLRRLLESKDIVRVLEAHNGISGLIVEETTYEAEGEIRNRAAEIQAPVWQQGREWKLIKSKRGADRVDLGDRSYDINDLSLAGEHQIQNAAVAIVA